MTLDVLLREGPELAAKEDQRFTPSDDRVGNAGDEDGVVTGVDPREHDALDKPDPAGQMGVTETRATHSNPDEVIVIAASKPTCQGALVLRQERDGEAAAGVDGSLGARTVGRAYLDDRRVERDARHGVRRHSLIAALAVRADDGHPGWKVSHQVTQRESIRVRQVEAVVAFTA